MNLQSALYIDEDFCDIGVNEDINAKPFDRSPCLSRPDNAGLPCHLLYEDKNNPTCETCALCGRGAKPCGNQPVTPTNNKNTVKRQCAMPWCEKNTINRSGFCRGCEIALVNRTRLWKEKREGEPPVEFLQQVPKHGGRGRNLFVGF